MINLESIKQEQCQAPSLKKTCPCTILPQTFFNFSDSRSRGGNQNLLSLPLLKKRREKEVLPGTIFLEKVHSISL